MSTIWPSTSPRSPGRKWARRPTTSGSPRTKAARANDALFYPVNPGREAASWERLHNEALDRFFAGTYKGEYENALIEEFMAGLPDTPPWDRAR